MTRFVTTASQIDAARQYASDSRDHTHVHDGWDRERQDHRWTVGKVAELVLNAALTADGIDVATDGTTAQQNDRYDLMVCGSTVDVKATEIPSMLCQVNGTVYRHMGEWLAACVVERNLSAVDVRGFIHATDYRESATFYPAGAMLPCGKPQAFKSGTYLLTDCSRLIGYRVVVDGLLRGGWSRVLAAARRTGHLRMHVLGECKCERCGSPEWYEDADGMWMRVCEQCNPAAWAMHREAVAS